MKRFSAHYLFYFATFAVISPFFQSFLRALGFDKSQLGVLQGVFCLAGALGVGPVGRLADRLGRRRDMLAAAIVVSALILVPLSMTSSMAVAAVLTALFGVAYKSAIPLGDALASTELPDPTRQYGRARSFGSIGFIVTLWIFTATGAIDITSARSILTCFLVTASLSVPVILMLPDSHRRARTAENPREPADNARLPLVFWTLMAVVFLSQLGMAAHYSFFTLYLQDVFKMEQSSWMWSIGSVAELPVIFLAGAIIARIGVWWMLVLALAAMSTRLLIYSAAPPVVVLAAAQVLHAGTFGLLHTSVIEFISRTVPATLRATAMTVYMALGLGAAQFAGSSMGGYIIERSDYQKMYLLYALFPLIGIAVLIVRRRRLIAAVATETPAR